MANVIFPSSYWKGGSCNWFMYPEGCEQEIEDFFASIGIEVIHNSNSIFGSPCYVTEDPVEFVPCDEFGNMTDGPWDHIEIVF